MGVRGGFCSSAFVSCIVAKSTTNGSALVLICWPSASGVMTLSTCAGAASPMLPILAELIFVLDDLALLDCLDEKKP